MSRRSAGANRVGLRSAGPADARRTAGDTLAAAGPTVSITETARALGVSRDLVYAMHQRGELADLGIKVLRLGSRLRVSTASLLRALAAPDEDEHG